jgi:nitrate reductase gamma subunit/ferredoxin
MATQTDSTTNGDKRLKPHQLSLGLGIGMGAFILLSGVLPQITHWHNENEVHRTVFGNVPGPLQIAFYTLIPVMVVWGAFRFADRMKNWERGAVAKRRTTTKNVKRRAADFRAGVYMRTLLRDSAAGLMHSMIYFGFLVLMGVTTVLEIDHQMPESLKFLHGTTYKAYAFVGDFAGTVFTVGVIWAIVRRYIQRPYRIRIKTKTEHAVILGTFLAIGLTGFIAEGFRIALDGMPDYEKFSFVGYPLATLVDGMSASAVSTWHQWSWIAHVVSFVVFLAILPVTMLRHVFTSPLNMYLRDKDRPKGAMKPMPNLMETELESFGASVVEDFTWKQLLDTDACTMCGRCTSVCPAHATGKPLDPREIVLKTGEVMAATGSPQVSPPIGVDGEIKIGANSLFERITAEEIWSCTSCKWLNTDSKISSINDCSCSTKS